MPRHLCTALSLLLLLCGCAAERSSALPNGRPRPLLTATRHTGIVLDGDLSDWKSIPFHTVTPASGVFDPQPRPTESPQDLSYRFALCYDAEALYIAVEVTDDSIRADSCPPGSVSCPAWDDDAVEVFIDANHNRAPDSRIADGSELRFGGEFALVANGAANSDYSGYPKTFGRSATWQGATNWPAIQRGEKTARYEFRLSWNVLGRQLRPNDTVGFTLSVQDDDDGGGRDHALYFVGLPPHLFRDERGFADLHLRP